MADQESESQPHAELATFGEDLRREREVRGISLKEIADATKISRRFLEAIERNDHKTLPAPVFTRGFVREYARYLGLNAEDMVSRYNHGAAGDDRIEQTAQLDRLVQPPTLPSLPQQAVKKRGIPPIYARIDRNLLVLVIIAAALAAVIWWAVQRKRATPEPIADAPAPVMAPASPPPAPAEPTQQPDDRLRLEIEVVANSWVVLEADGQVIVNDELKQGDRRTVEANETFRFRTVGNAAGIALTLNGIRLPALGGEGEVIKNRTFDRDALQELRSNEPRTES
jgi:transcriptional regulator with XRE-family HTH domain